eukprot:500067-Amphidinium_carterae.3
MKALVFGTTEAIRAHRISTHTMQRLVGDWVHHCLYQRSALCVLQHTYQWIEQGKSQPYRPRLLPGFVKQELQGFILLFPLIRADLRSCLCPEIFASDATEQVGAVVKASASLEDMVLAWTRRTHHLSPGYAVLEANNLYHLDRAERKDSIWEELIAKQSFKLVTKYAFRSHINVKELLAVRTALRHVVSDSSRWWTRFIIAVDSQVAVWCLKKGR